MKLADFTMRPVTHKINIDLTIGGFRANYYIGELYTNSFHLRYEIIRIVYNPVQRYLKNDI
jgi:hypothetical protein